MLRHIVLVSFKPEASEAQLAAWLAAVTNLCETSEEVLSFTLGSNVGSGPNHHDAARSKKWTKLVGCSAMSALSLLNLLASRHFYPAATTLPRYLKRSWLGTWRVMGYNHCHPSATRPNYVHGSIGQHARRMIRPVCGFAGLSWMPTATRTRKRQHWWLRASTRR